MERPTVEKHFESFSSLFRRKFENRRRRQLVYIYIAEFDGSRAGNQFDATADTDGFTRHIRIGHHGILDYFHIVFEDGDTVVHDLYIECIPITRPVIGIRNTFIVRQHTRTGHTAQTNLRNGPYRDTGLSRSFPVENHLEVFVLLRELDRGSVCLGREDTVCQGPFLRHCCVSLQLCLCQGLWLHGLAGLGVSDYGFPVLRFERQGLESGLGEFCHKSLYLVDGISCIGVGLGEFDVYFQGLFQGCGYRLTTHAGVLRGDGLHDQCRRFGRRGSVHILHGEYQGGEYRGFKDKRGNPLYSCFYSLDEKKKELRFSKPDAVKDGFGAYIYENSGDEMKKDQFPELPMWTPGTKRVYISMAILLVYMLVLSTLGFIIPSVIMLFAFCQWFHKGAFWKNALISVIVVLAIYFIFKNFLNVPIDFGMFSI